MACFSLRTNWATMGKWSVSNSSFGRLSTAEQHSKFPTGPTGGQFLWLCVGHLSTTCLWMSGCLNHVPQMRRQLLIQKLRKWSVLSLGVPKWVQWAVGQMICHLQVHYWSLLGRERVRYGSWRWLGQVERRKHLSGLWLQCLEEHRLQQHGVCQRCAWNWQQWCVHLLDAIRSWHDMHHDPEPRIHRHFMGHLVLFLTIGRNIILQQISNARALYSAGWNGAVALILRYCTEFGSLLMSSLLWNSD